MERKYIAPLTEIVIISAENILEGQGGNQDSHGEQDPWQVDTNSGSFDTAEDGTSGKKSLWED